MINWIVKNIGTIVTSSVLIVIIASIVIGMIRDRKKGKSSCGCKCSACPMGGSCHKAGALRKAPKPENLLLFLKKK